jgi:hypothetical protein
MCSYLLKALEISVHTFSKLFVNMKGLRPERKYKICLNRYYGQHNKRKKHFRKVINKSLKGSIKINQR